MNYLYKSYPAHMLEHYLRYSRWQVFVRTGLPYLLGWILSKLGFVLFLQSWPGGSSLMLVGNSLMLLGAVAGLSWLSAVIFKLRRIRQVEVDGRFVISVAILAIIVYHLLYLTGSIIHFMGSGVIPGSFLSFYQQFTWFALASLVLLAYKAALSLEGAEGNKKLEAKQKWINVSLFLLLPIGAWWLQPRIQKAALKSDELGIEDHLTVD